MSRLYRGCQDWRRFLYGNKGVYVSRGDSVGTVWTGGLGGVRFVSRGWGFVRETFLVLGAQRVLYRLLLVDQVLAIG